MRSKLILFALCAASVPGSALAQVTSSPLRRDALQEQAARAIPFDQLSEGSRTKLWQVVSQPSVFRRMPAKTIECDPDLYVFLARYPEVVVNIWQLMGVTTVDMKRTGDFAFWATDGSGTTSSVELIYGTREMHVFYAEGVYEGPLFLNKSDGRCVMVLHSSYAPGNANTKVSSQLDLFLSLDHAGAELVAKTLHPLVGRTADNNFVESVKFFGKVSEAAQTNGDNLHRLASRLERVEPVVRDEFIRLTSAISSRYSQPQTWTGDNRRDIESTQAGLQRGPALDSSGGAISRTQLRR